MALLDLIACVEADDGRLAAIAAAAESQRDWPAIIAEAERHGLAPLLYRHLRDAGAACPAAARRQLQGLYLRHRHANDVRLEKLPEVLRALRREGIEAAVLKGAALCHLLYPDPALRPMSDLDLLVPAAHCQDAQAVLRDLGFHAAERHRRRSMRRHHHLPAATLSQAAVEIAVEIHADALCGDCPVSLPWDRLRRPLRAYPVGGEPARTLGHEDMLWQLCWHALSPAPLLRRIWLVDIVGYAERFAAQIDWRRLRDAYPFVLNALAMIHFVLPLPPALKSRVPPPAGPAPAGTGVVHRPLSEIARTGRPWAGWWRDLFYPSDWWLRVYYYRRREAPLWWYRWVRHPWQVSRWLWRRWSPTPAGGAGGRSTE